ncbi:MAG: hypothetical protein Q9163_002905 [Psora crenata]
MSSDSAAMPNEDPYKHSADQAGSPESNDTMSSSLEKYSFPHRKLKRVLKDGTRTPLVLVACGSFSPPTYLHLRMFEIAADYVRENTPFEVIGGYMSPVNSEYKKEGLVSAEARIKMCILATTGHDWLSVDDWEALNPSYVPTARVLDHFDEEIKKLGGLKTDGGEVKPVRVALLAGADLISTFAKPGVWDKRDLEHILGKYGCFILERMGVNIDESLENLDRWASNIWFINQPVMNDVSSTTIRLFLKKDLSIRCSPDARSFWAVADTNQPLLDLIPSSVINFIYENELYNVKPPTNGHKRNVSRSRKPLMDDQVHRADGGGST